MRVGEVNAGRWVVTGANGFIGKNLCNYLGHRNIPCDAWTRDNIDLTNKHQVRDRLAQFNPNTVVHLAASNPYADNERYSAMKADFSMLVNLLDHLPDHCKFIYAGSVAEYGCSGTLSEEQVCQPVTDYGIRKLVCSRLVQDFVSSTSANALVARIFGVYGRFEKPFRLLPSLVRSLSEGHTLELSDGNQIRDFVYVEDLCETLFQLAAVEKFTTDLVNIGTGCEISVKDVCLNVADSLGADRSLLKFGVLDRRSFDEDYQVADTRRLEVMIDFCPPNRLGEIKLDLSTIYK